ncbi:MAG: hypothetical protein RIQ93_535 [Verrucomicrobiota bacterium]|jgi:CheY-like chemotaxis protein
MRASRLARGGNRRVSCRAAWEKRQQRYGITPWREFSSSGILTEATRTQDIFTDRAKKVPMLLDRDLPSQPSQRSIFLVDDESEDVALFRHLHREAGDHHSCVFFSRGEELIDALIAVLRGAPRPVACFLDVKMSGMSGFDVLRWIRCQRGLDDIAVVMLSSSEEPRDLHEALLSGAQCYLAKFPSPHQLREILAEAERVAAAATISAFKLPCNLLLTNSPAGC